MATITVKAFPPLSRVRRHAEDNESGCYCQTRTPTPSRIPRAVKVKKGKTKKKKISSANLVSIDTSKAGGQLDVLRLCIGELGWKEYPGGRKTQPCDFYWFTGNYINNMDELYKGRVNKFPGMTDIAHKISMARALEHMRTLYPEEYDFFPRTWLLPQEYHEFCAEIELEKKHKHRKSKYTFIVKPNEGSQGDGIYLIRDPRDYHLSMRTHVVQEYVTNPLLIDKLKFDLRVYVVLTSIDPVRIYIHREGMARFCTIPYQTPTNKNLHESYMHLTNYSLNKHSRTYVHTDNKHDGSKRMLRSVFLQMERHGLDTVRAWEEIEKCSVKTILAMIPELRIAHSAEFPSGKPSPSCFQILGFDFLLTKDLKPILLEVNSSPSLRIDHEKEISIGVYEYVPSVIDEDIKRPLVRETLKVLAPPSKLRKRVFEDTFDMVIDAVEKEQQVVRSPSSMDDEDLLVEIYPSKYGSCFKELTLLDRIATLFQSSLGVRKTVRMGSSGFRSFARKCRLTSQGISNAELDIIFIEQCRRWDFLNPDGTAGLNLQGFMEAFSTIAKRKFHSSNKATMVENLVDFCEANMHFSNQMGGPKTMNLPNLEANAFHSKRLQDLKSIYISQRKARFRRPGENLFLTYLHQSGDSSRKATKKSSPFEDKSGSGDGKSPTS